MWLSKSSKKDNVKNIAKSDSDFNYDSNYNFYKFYKRYDEFEEMPLDSKYNWIKKFNNLLIKFKALKPQKRDTQLKKERITKNADELCEKYYSAYKNNYDNDDELREAKNQKLATKSLNCLIKQIKSQH